MTSVSKSDARSEEAALYRRLYKTAQWQRIRQHQLATHPLCQWCIEREVVTEATEVHHAEAHRGDVELFFSGPFISTCKPCHASRGQLEDNGKTVVRYGPDGWPI
ncbi:HNH endonuclease [Rhizobium sp. 12,4]|uniref:HNH endonuclease n=1 Tax=Rhizobium sp. 12,4 TaxID=3405135 RepID=UPI003D347D41